MTYIVQADLEARLTSPVLVQILDDDGDGDVDSSDTGLAAVIADAESYVEGFLRGNYSLTDLRAQGVSCPREVKRLCIDVAVAYLVDRHPEYIRADGRGLLERARRDLIDLRNGVTRLDVVSTPEPAANQGGEVYSGDPDDTDPEDPWFQHPDSFGVF